MASIVGKKRGGATYYYLVESARVGGKPRITSQEYLGTAEELAAAMRGGGLGLPDRIQHRSSRGRRHVGRARGSRRGAGHRRGRPSAARRCRRQHRDLPVAGGAEPGGRAVFEAGLCGLVGEDGGVPVRQDSRDGAGSPAVLGRDARRHAGGPGRDQPPDRAGDRGPVRAGLLVGGAAHDQLRHLHRHRVPQSPDRAARQGQAEALRPAAGGAGPGRHPGRRDPADLARLPRRPAGRHPVPRHDQGAAQPVRAGHDGLRVSSPRT